MPAALLAFGGLALAADDEVPDAEFIEYLGMWEASDEEWMMFEKESKSTGEEKRNDPAPQGEESAENGNED